jgi:pimeloyl-ACP methyl ester carboxylesterase
VPEVRANGLDIHYTVEGEGPPLVLLHAATSSSLEDWAAQRPVFRQHFRCYLPDARGHARTRWDVREGWSYAQLVDDLEAFADALDLARFHVAGLSMGAVTALSFAMRDPGRLRSAVLAAAAVEDEPRSSIASRVMRAAAAERDDPAWAALLARRHDPAQGDGAWRRLLDAIRDAILAYEPPTPEQLRGARVPILLAYGDRDPWVPLEQAVRLRRQLPDARLFVSPGAGHVVVVENAGLFTQAALAFLRLSSRDDA